MRKVIDVLEVAERDWPAEQVLVQRSNEMRLHQLAVKQRLAKQPTHQYELNRNKVSNVRNVGVVIYKQKTKQKKQADIHKSVKVKKKNTK